jgi:hypothetical protein
MPLFTNDQFCFLLSSGSSSGDLKSERVPKDFSALLLERHRNCGDSVRHKTAFQYFATRILPAVNASLTKYDRRKYKENLSECFSYTDEAFGILLVVNYETRWNSQHAAEMSLPGGTSQERSDKWEDAKYTSSSEGARRGVSWPREGLVKFNELSQMVKRQREVEGEESMVEAELLAWCRKEAKMPELATSSNNQSSGGDHGEEEEEEVEAWGECGIFEVQHL